MAPAVDRLAGAKVADVGCGHGASRILMAEAHPNSTFVGFDYHQPSIEWARASAARVGVAERVKFAMATAKAYPGSGYDFDAFFDCLHDMGDPEGAARHVLKSMSLGGCLDDCRALRDRPPRGRLEPRGKGLRFFRDSARKKWLRRN
jgi:2-polyprenyl-3-methyl-5-hydroxy-6-metoxy-1,4-benzoquinol methylase